MSDLAIGIDLGTTNSCVSVYRDKSVEIIPNDQGRLITASYVAFSDSRGRLVGADAKAHAPFEPENTIFDAKRLIGRKFDDPDIKQDIKSWPFKVVNEHSKPKIEVYIQGKVRRYHPEEISSMILGKLKDIAENHLGQVVKNCVITVPAYFNDSQRQATIDAGKIAGLNVLKIINEPTAAAIAYGFIKKEDREQNVLIYDLGGGTFDVSILKIKGTNMRVLSTDGNTHLGGEDFDSRIVKYAIEEFEMKYKGINLYDNKKALKRIRTACEKAKTTLSSATMTSIEVDNLINDLDMNIKLTRQKFEDINEDLFKSTIRTVEYCLKEAKLTKDEIDEIVLIGGSSRIPKIRSIVQKFFNGKELNKSINPDEAVAYGAAVCAAMVGGNITREIRDVSFRDVTSMSLGIEVVNNLVSVIIPRNSPVPAKNTRTYTTTRDYQTDIDIEILEGDKVFADENNKLGKFKIAGFPALKKGVIKIEVTFEVNENGILNVDGVETSTGKKNQIQITHEKGLLSKEEIQRMTKDNEHAREKEQNRQKIINIKNEMYDYCSKMQQSNTPNKIIDECQNLEEWLDNNSDKTFKEYEIKFDEIKSFCERNQNNKPSEY